MSKIKGQDLVVLFDMGASGYKAVAYATDCELDLTIDMQPFCPPPSDGQSGIRWQQNKPKRISWTVTSAHLLSDQEQPVDFDELIRNKTKVQVVFACVQPHPDPEADPPQYALVPGVHTYAHTGSAYIKRHTVTARNRTYVTSSIELTGTGPLFNGPYII